MTASQIRAELASQRLESSAGPIFPRVTQFILAQKPRRLQGDDQDGTWAGGPAETVYL